MPPLLVPLSSANCATLCAIFAVPTRADVVWNDFARLVRALGGEWRKPGRSAGSGRRAVLNGVRGLFHEPHPDPRIKKGSVESARMFLSNAGVTPQSEGCKCHPTS
jgi:hypothetical protein